MSNVSASTDINNKDNLNFKQVSPLPIGSGGGNDLKRQMNNLNVQLTMLQAQSNADAVFDPPVPTNVTKQATIEKFTNYDNQIGTTILILGAGLLLFGVFSK